MLQGDLNQDETINITDILILIDLLLVISEIKIHITMFWRFDNNYGLNILDIINLTHKNFGGYK